MGELLTRELLRNAVVAVFRLVSRLIVYVTD